MKDKAKRILVLFIPILFMLLIIWFSTRNGVQSNGFSKGIAKTIASENTSEFSLANHIIRKLAHFSEYFVLSILVYFAMGGFRLNQFKRAFFTVITFIAFASLDETVQRFIPGRESRFTDVLIDTFGALCGLGLVLIISSRKLKRYAFEQKQNQSC